jgi:tetratricopeptide (TPR) repeat protein
MMIKYFFIVSFLIGVTTIFAQTTKHYDVTDGDEHMSHRNYVMALPIYKEVLKKEKDDASLHFKIAECYLNTNINKTEAIKYLEFCAKAPKPSPEVYLRLGQAYRLANKIGEAIKAFEKFKELDPKQKKIADRQIEICNNAKALMLNPVNVSIIIHS